MTFLWHEAFAFILLVPIAIGTYLFVLGRKKDHALRYPGVGLLREVIGPGQRTRLHLPPVLFLFSLTALAVAIARPVTVVMLPGEQRTVILAIDVSLSMGATDVAPSRLAAAQAAARAFVKTLPADARVGILAFSGSADLVQAPTAELHHVLDAIDTLALHDGTAIGGAVLASLLTIFPNADIVGGYDIWGLGRTPDGPPSLLLDAPPQERKRVRFARVAPGSCTWAAIILLTDGRRTMGPDPQQAARAAADLGVRVFTVAFGLPQPMDRDVEGATGNAGPDEATLREIAGITHGQYFRAANAGELRRIYENLTGRVTFEKRELEVTALFTALAAVLALTAATLSLLWSNRLA